VHIYFAQAIPLIAYIDESCLYLKEDKCRICEAVCKNNAIDFTQKPQKMNIRVGAIILSPGFEPFDPKVMKEYRYGEFKNVVTSMDYERLLCSTGPYQGEILRASDKKTPPQYCLDPVCRFKAGNRGWQQLLFGSLLHIYTETGNPYQRPRCRCKMYYIP